MGKNKEYVTRAALTSETVEEIEKMKDFMKEMEENLDRDAEESSYRLNNGQFDRDALIRKAVEKFNE